MIRLFLLCFVTNLVSANSLANLLLPPKSNCNQDGFNVPIQSSNIQSYVTSHMIQNPANNCPCNPQFGRENGLPVQIKMDDGNHSYLNKLLANPMLQNILSPNNNNCNQNSNSHIQAHPDNTPNIINNYYIIPPECMKGSESGIEFVKNLIGNQAVVCQSDGAQHQKNTGDERKNSQQSTNRQNKEVKLPKGTIRPRNRESDQRHKNSKQQIGRDNGSQHSGNHRNKNHNRTINKQNSNKNGKANEGKGSSHKRNDNRNNSSPRNASKKRKRPKNSGSDSIDNDNRVINETIIVNNDTLPCELTEEVKLNNKEKQVELQKYSTDEEVIKDIHKKFPGIPEDVIKRLVRYLKAQLRNQQNNNNECCTEPNNNNNPRNTPKKRKKHRRPQNKSTLTEVSSSSTADNVSVSNIQTSTVNINGVLNSAESDTKSRDNKEEYITQHKIKTELIEITTKKYNDSPKLGEEDAILDLENDVNDYFPDFRHDKVYMTEDEYIRHFRDNNRFYYTTDRNDFKNNNDNVESSDFFYKPFRKTSIEMNSDEIEDTLMSPNSDYDHDREESSEEIEFQTPPILEHPDFETKPITKLYNERNPSHDHVHYDSTTTPSKYKPKSGNIDTVFADSKVAKYGKSDDIQDTLTTYYEPDDTVIVYARTMNTDTYS